VSLCYNIGIDAFTKSSVVRLFNAGDTMGASRAFLLWNKGTIKGKKVFIRGLADRRADEQRLFLSQGAVAPVEPRVEAPATKPTLWELILNFLRTLLK
jgi:hypothetical protein